MPGYHYDEKEGMKDQLLWAAVIDGDRNALGILFDTYAKQLMVYGYRICADKTLVKDAIQDVFVDIWTYRSNLASQVRVKFYLYRSLRRAIQKQMTNLPLLRTETEHLETIIGEQASAESDWVLQETETQHSRRILHSLKQLSDREREIISLKYYSDLKIREIADMLDLKEQTVANTLQNALTKLRKSLVLGLLFCQMLAENFF